MVTTRRGKQGPDNKQLSGRDKAEDHGVPEVEVSLETPSPLSGEKTATFKTSLERFQYAEGEQGKPVSKPTNGTPAYKVTRKRPLTDNDADDDKPALFAFPSPAKRRRQQSSKSVSYTHLTLPTKRIV